MGKEIIKTSLILFVITAVAALLLAFVNAKTAPVIAQNNQKKTQEALKVVMSEASSFEEVEKDETAAEAETKYDSEIVNLYEAQDESGSTIGVCAIVETKGYDVGIQSAVGVNKEGTVTGVEIISHKETPGLGANAEKDEFKSQYTGKTSDIEVVKSGAAGNQINAISGATMTSNGVTKAVNTVTQIAGEMFK